MDFPLYFQNVIWPGGSIIWAEETKSEKAKPPGMCPSFAGNVGETQFHQGQFIPPSYHHAPCPVLLPGHQHQTAVLQLEKSLCPCWVVLLRIWFRKTKIGKLTIYHSQPCYLVRFLIVMRTTWLCFCTEQREVAWGELSYLLWEHLPAVAVATAV